MVFHELVLEVNEDNHEEFLEHDFSVLNFFSDWHMNCLSFLPIIDSLAEDFMGKIFFGRVNVEECNLLAEKYEIQKIPAVLIFKNGKPVDRIDNCNCEEDLRERISGLFGV